MQNMCYRMGTQHKTIPPARTLQNALTGSNDSKGRCGKL